MLEAMILVPAAFAWLARYYAKDQFCMNFLPGGAVAALALFGAGKFCAALGSPRIIVCPQRQALKEGVEADAWGGVTVGFCSRRITAYYELMPIGT